MTNLDEAFRMLDIFASCGAQSFVVTKTELEWHGHKKLKWGKTYSLAAVRKKLPQILRTAAITHSLTLPEGQQVLAGENVIVRPTGPGIVFLQLDDLKTQQLDRVRPAAFVIHETSPGNNQAWIAVAGIPVGKEDFKEFTRRVRKAVGENDKSASHATRLAGTGNWKVKYLPHPPIVRILEAHPGRIVKAEQLESLGLLAPSQIKQSLSVIDLHPRRSRLSHDHERQWPDYRRCLLGAPPASEGNNPSRSHADFFWCKMAAQRGWSIKETAQKLLEVSEKAQERARCGDEGYAPITAHNAAAAAARGRNRGRG